MNHPTPTLSPEVQKIINDDAKCLNQLHDVTTVNKADFKRLHSSNSLLLLAGHTSQPLNHVIDTIAANWPGIEQNTERYTIPTSKHGNLNTTKDGQQTVNIYRKGRVIYLVTITDSSKDPNCSWNDVSKSISVYLIKEDASNPTVLKLSNKSIAIPLKEADRSCTDCHYHYYNQDELVQRSMDIASPNITCALNNGDEICQRFIWKG